MTDLQNFNNYKLAKDAIPKFEEALAIIEVTYHSLNRYRKYNILKDACSELNVRREIIKVSLDKLRKIVDNKGI